MRSNDDIGALGQKLFEAWCAQARFTAIPASPDKLGWDYFIQLRAPAGPHDAPERSCKVQVKTTAEDEPTANIKLSNWERMAKERIPWFVLHVVLDEVEARTAYLVHVDESQVARVLAKLRGLSPDDEPRATRMVLTATKNDALAHPFHESLRERLLAYLGPSEEAYFAQKSQWIKRAGYEDRPFTFTVTVPEIDEAAFFAQMADWAVGLIDKLPIASIKAAETRFGITLPYEKFPSGEGFFQFVSLPSLGPTIVTLTNRERSDSVAIKCSTHVASKVVPFLPPEYERFRFVGEYMSLLVFPKDTGTVVRVHFDIPGSGTSLSLSEASKACRALRLFAQAPAGGVFASVANESSSSTLDLCQTTFDPDPEFQRFAQVMEGASYIARHFDLDAEMKVDPAELLSQNFQVSMFHAGLNRAIGDWGVKVHVDADENPAGKGAAIVLGTVVNLGAHVVGAVFALIGTATWTSDSGEGGGSLGIDNPVVRVCFQQNAPRAEWDGSVLPRKIDETAEKLEADGIAIVASERGRANWAIRTI